jgi:hypothetical protein
MIGGVLVVVGVAGEFWFQQAASSKQTTLRANSHQIEGMLNKEAGDAANHAALLDRENIVLRENVVKLEKRMLPRNLTLDQQRVIASQLKRFAGTHVNLLVYPADDEAFAIAREIEMSLGTHGANWTVAFVTRPDFDRVVSGVLVEISQGVAAEIASTKSLVDVLNTAGHCCPAIR